MRIQSIFERVEEFSPLKKELIKHSGIMYASNFISLFFRFLLVFLLARAIGPSKYGLIQLAISVAGFISLLIDIRIGEAVVKFTTDYLVSGDKQKASAVIILGYIVDFVLGLISFLIIFSTAGLISNYILHQSQELFLIRIYAFAVLVSIINGTSMAVLQTFKKFNLIGIFTIVHSFFYFLLPVLFIQYGLLKIMSGYVFSATIGAVMINIFAGIILIQEFKNTGFYPFWLIGPKIFRFSIQTFLSVTFKSAQRYIDVLILGFFKNPAAVGYYKIALSYTGVLGIIASPIGLVVYPTLSSLWSQKNIDVFKRLIKKISRIMAIITIPLSFAMILFAPLLLRLTVKEQFIPAIPAIYIVIWVSLFTNIAAWLRSAVLAIGKPEISTKANLYMVILLVVLSILLIPAFSYIGSAIVYLISNIFGIVLILLLLKSEINKISNNIS